MVTTVATKSWATYDPGPREGRLKSSGTKRLGNYTTYLATESRSIGRDATSLQGGRQVSSNPQWSLRPRLTKRASHSLIFGAGILKATRPIITAIPHPGNCGWCHIQNPGGHFSQCPISYEGLVGSVRVTLLQAKLQLSSSNHNPEPTNSRSWRWT